MAANKMFLELILMQQILFKNGRDEKELAVLSYKYFFETAINKWQIEKFSADGAPLKKRDRTNEVCVRRDRR